MSSDAMRGATGGTTVSSEDLANKGIGEGVGGGHYLI